MGAPFFKFRQFTVWHDRCAMKVGTDGVLLGAWAGQDRPGEILDIGTGSGLIALMLAQRFPKARITGIDCDKDAAMQAKENFTGSPWADRLRTVHIGLQGFCRDTVTAAERFDLIVSNPPFYDNTLTNPDSRRCTARHTGGLPHDELLLLSAGLLTDSGVFSLIVPSESERSTSPAQAHQSLFQTRFRSPQNPCLFRQKSRSRPGRRLTCTYRRGRTPQRGTRSTYQGILPI